MSYKEIELYESPMKERNEEKYGYSSKNQCICCMKPMAEGETKMVHMNTDWKAMNVAKAEDVPSDRESQGFFEIGNSCAKKMPKEFIF